MNESKLKKVIKYYRNSDKIIKSIGYRNEKGNPEGLVEYFYPNGKKQNEEPMVNGKTHGEVRWWDVEGNLIDSYTVVNGNGPVRTWNEYGVKLSDGQTRDGLYIGKLLIFHESGEVNSTTYHINGGEVKKSKYIEAMQSDPTLPSIE